MDTPTTEIYAYSHTLSLHEALPICPKFNRLKRGATVFSPTPRRKSPTRVRPWPPPRHASRPLKAEIGRAHVRTPVTNAHLVCRLLLEKNTKESLAFIHQIERHNVCTPVKHPHRVSHLMQEQH